MYIYKFEILKWKFMMCSIIEVLPPASPKFQKTEFGGEVEPGRQVQVLTH